mmetsp:Transcript_101796/g.164113  ORF Transcript_101796/g.164113 Transcript_101796/m.164113 type:complete len:199 (+) Transcript_101796:346-942(+)
MGKKNAPTAKGGSAIGLLPEKILALEGHHAAFTVKAMKYTEETWTKRISAAMRIAQEARQLSFIITTLNKDSFLSEAMIMNFLATLGLSPADHIIQSVADLKWNRLAQGAPTPQYRVMIKENVAWPLSFIQALSTGPNVAVAGNDGRVEKRCVADHCRNEDDPKNRRRTLAGADAEEKEEEATAAKSKEKKGKNETSA